MTANVLRSSTFDKITQSDHLSTSPADSGMQIKHNCITTNYMECLGYIDPALQPYKN